MESKSKPEISSEQIAELVQDFLLNQKTYKDLRGISDNEMETIYSIAFNFYSHGKFDRAKNIFAALTQLDTYKPKYWVGLGASRQMLKEYQPAIDAYGFATLMDAKDPKPVFYSSSCFLKLDKPNLAILALEAAIEISGTSPEHKDVRSQAENLLEGLRKKEATQSSK